MKGLTLRKASQSDYDNVIALMRQLNPDDPTIERKKGIEIFSSILADNGLTIFIAELRGQSVATCFLNVIPNLTRGGRAYAVIENVVTSEAHRRNGIGEAMLKKVMDKAFENDCYKVMLLTGRDENVHTFYERCGMEKHSKTAFVKRN